MRFEWFVAQRYLRSPYRPPVLRLVTLLSVLGVAAGVATLVIALSMNTGFRETLQDRHDTRQDRHGMRHDRRDVRQDRRPDG